MNEKDNTSLEYVAIRVQVVKVKKRFFGYKDEVLGFTTVIPNTMKDAEILFKKIGRMCKKYGVEIKVE